ncbi:MAG: hypothetical protein Q8N23_27610 [Archangium sp.]|nr:hypothetical protein [Archangium sp.]MDP3156475.1 hypothetical protein [Archangium sp.]MDP3571666.1 hypothetical protein [Archangium sp.]
MNGRQLAGPLLAILVAVGVYALWPKEKVSPEDEIRALVARVVGQAEKRDSAGVTEALSDSFRGGGLSKQEVRQLVLGQFFKAKQIVVLNPLLEVTVKSPTEGRFKGTFLFGRDGAGPEASRYTIEADVLKTGDGWHIIAATWSR